jgi:hypothetical protein
MPRFLPVGILPALFKMAAGLKEFHRRVRN